jgi:hypothetical protein
MMTQLVGLLRSFICRFDRVLMIVGFLDQTYISLVSVILHICRSRSLNIIPASLTSYNSYEPVASATADLSQIILPGHIMAQGRPPSTSFHRLLDHRTMDRCNSPPIHIDPATEIHLRWPASVFSAIPSALSYLLVDIK